MVDDYYLIILSSFIGEVAFYLETYINTHILK